MSIFTLKAILLVFLRSGSTEVTQRSALVNTNENLKLDSDDIISRRTSGSLLSCTQQCLSDPLCATFNYGSSSASQGICELYKKTDKMKLIHEPGWLCGHLLDRKKIVKTPAECKTWRTKEGGCCVFPFLYQGKYRDSCVFDEQLWCSITENYDVDKMHGVCEDFNFTFTTLGALGSKGPPDTSGYQATTLQHKVTLDNGIQIWQVPLSGSYVIEAWGASGAEGRESGDVSAAARPGGIGAYMRGTFNFTRGTNLTILVGQAGSKGITGEPLPGGGGGGTFVTSLSNAPLIVAGGGGGGVAKLGNMHEGDPGQTTGNGSRAGGSNGSGGDIYEQGSPSNSFECGAGGGLNGDGKSGRVAEGGKGFVNGGKGGDATSGGNGGFGGGGAGFMFPGAGGGYSGGGVLKDGSEVIAGGGGSFNSGADPVKKEGVMKGDGKVIITLVKPEKEYS